MKSILITGGTGFIGQQLCPDLLSKGYELTVLSRQSNADVRSICVPRPRDLQHQSKLASLYTLKSAVDKNP